MSDYCQQCSIDIFGKDFKELADIALEGEFATAICEGCGSIVIDHNGTCLSACLRHHSTKWEEENG